MNPITDRVNLMFGRTRFVVCRLFVHMKGSDITPMLGLLNRTAREAIASDGDLSVIGEGLVEICHKLVENDAYWQSAANEGDVFWDEGEAGDYWTELFTDSGQRYLSEIDPSQAETSPDEILSLPVTHNLVVMLTVAYEGEVPDLETDLSNIEALGAALNALINLHYQEKLRAIQIHFSPAQLGDLLTDEQLLEYFPELIPL